MKHERVFYICHEYRFIIMFNIFRLRCEMRPVFAFWPFLGDLRRFFGPDGITGHLSAKMPLNQKFAKNNFFLKDFWKNLWKLKLIAYICTRNDERFQPTRRVPGTQITTAMKIEITYDAFNFFFEAMINNNDSDYFMKCKALESDGFEMVNNGWPEDGETFTVYHKKTDMGLFQ